MKRLSVFLPLRHPLSILQHSSQHCLSPQLKPMMHLLKKLLSQVLSTEVDIPKPETPPTAAQLAASIRGTRVTSCDPLHQLPPAIRLGDREHEYYKTLKRKLPLRDGWGPPQPSVKYSLRQAASQHSRFIVVLGAGIAGLQTALSLRITPELDDFGIVIIAEDMPPAHRVTYTSPQAGGHWRSHVTDAPGNERVMAFEKRTYEYWRSINRYLEVPPEVIPEGIPLEYLLAIPLELPEGKQVEQYHGLRPEIARYYWGEEAPPETANGDGSGLWWRGVVDGFKIVDLEAERLEWEKSHFPDDKPPGTMAPERIPEGAIMGAEYQTFCFDPDEYLRRRMLWAKEFGVRIIKRKVATEGGLEGVVDSSKRILKTTLDPNMEPKAWKTIRSKGSLAMRGLKKRLRICESESRRKSKPTPVALTDSPGGDEHTPSQESAREPQVFAFVNCTGLAAREFVNDEEMNLLFPNRGQTVVVKGQAKICRTYAKSPDSGPDDLLYVVPQAWSNTTVLGGCKQDDNSSTEEDPDMKQKILDGIKKYHLADELRTGPGGEFEILNYYPPRLGSKPEKRLNVGFRPSRTGGPRVELETQNGGKIDGTWVLHNYGHGGGGYQSSVGCAEEIVRLVTEKLGSTNPSGMPRFQDLFSSANPADVASSIDQGNTIDEVNSTNVVHSVEEVDAQS